ncbi:hypothetical protein ENH_00016380, partial [Eimeria necatrix]
YRVRPRFRTVCPLLEADERLQQKYGGAACPGLFPTWDEEGILEEVHECINQPPPDMESYPVNLEWDNVAGLAPENQEERPWWYSQVHFPTRRAVQRAFEEGVEDFRKPQLQQQQPQLQQQQLQLQQQQLQLQLQQQQLLQQQLQLQQQQLQLQQQQLQLQQQQQQQQQLQLQQQ